MPPEDEVWDQLAREAQQAREAGETERALALYRKALKQNPSWKEGWLNVGGLLADSNNCVAALEALRVATELDPLHGDAWALSGVCEFRLRRYDEALKHLEKARGMPLAHKAFSQLLYYHSALILVRRGDFDSARQRLTLLAREGGGGTKLEEALGLAALRRAVLPEDAAPDLRAVAREVGSLLHRSEARPVADVRRGFIALIRKYPGFPGLHFALGSFLAARGLHREAYEAFLAELAAAPHDPFTRIQIASLLLNPLNRPEEARAMAAEATRLAPQEFAARLILGKALLRTGQISRAVEELEAAVRLAPASTAGHYALLGAYRKAGRRAEVVREEAILKRLHKFEQSLQPAGAAPESGAGGQR